MKKGHGAAITFAVGLGVSLVLPPLTLWFLLHFGDAHGGLIFLLLRPLAGAYPFISVVALPGWLAWTLTVLQMAGLSALFARYCRVFALHQQIFAAIVLIVVLAIFGDILYALFDLELRSKAFTWA